MCHSCGLPERRQMADNAAPFYSLMSVTVVVMNIELRDIISAGARLSSFYNEQ